MTNAQLAITELDASSVNSQTFEPLLDEDVQVLMSTGALIGYLTAISTSSM